MRSLPEYPTYDSVKYALEELSGPEEYIIHVQQYIELLHANLVRIKDISSKVVDQNITPIGSLLVTEETTTSKLSKKYTVLIVEDDSGINELIKNFLENAGYNVLSAEAGQVGIDLAVQHIPDLIICDIHLPGMHGLDVIRVLKSNSTLLDIPIIMLTADLFKGEESYDIGVNEYIMKPIRKNEFMKYVYKYLPEAD